MVIRASSQSSTLKNVYVYDILCCDTLPHYYGLDSVAIDIFGGLKFYPATFTVFSVPRDISGVFVPIDISGVSELYPAI